jgi:hypothetical protein
LWQAASINGGKIEKRAKKNYFGYHQKVFKWGILTVNSYQQTAEISGIISSNFFQKKKIESCFLFPTKPEISASRSQEIFSELSIANCKL